MPRRNRVDPWGDLHAVAARGLLTGNRGCLVDDRGAVVRHHAGVLWIVCRTEWGGRRQPLAQRGSWTPLFFLDDAVALAAGHRPCAACRRADYTAYRDAASRAAAAPRPLGATELNARLSAERLRRGRGLDRSGDRIVWQAPFSDLPDGTVVVDAGGGCRLVAGHRLPRFSADGWRAPVPRPGGTATILTPPTSVGALREGYRPLLHPSAS